MWTAVGLLAGCEKEEAISSYTAPKDPQTVQWKVPDGWVNVPYRPVPEVQGMRVPGLLQFGAFAAGSGEGQPQITVTTMFRDTGNQDLLLNVNRWRNQVGLAPAEVSELSRLVNTTRDANGVIQWADFTGTSGQRMRAAIVPREERNWFFKMVGSSERVEAEKDHFDAFVMSSQFLTPAASPLVATGAESGAISEPAHPAINPPSPVTPASTPGSVGAVGHDADGLTYKTPAGWLQKPNPNKMRKLTLSTGSAEPAEIVVTQLSANFGGMLPNLDRWCDEVGLPHFPDAASVPESPIQLGAEKGILIDLSGPGRDGSKPMRSLIARRTQGDSVWFVKMLGPTQTITQQRPAFEEFLASVKLPGEAAK